MGEIFSRRLRRRSDFFTSTLLPLGFALCVSLAALTNAAHAAGASNADTASATMDVFVGIANLVGAPIPKEAVPIIQGMVSCALDVLCLILPMHWI